MSENRDAQQAAQSIAVTLPDGRRREFPGPLSGAELAAAIGAGLARAALAVKIDGRPRDLATLDRKSTRLNSSHQIISYAVFCLKKKTIKSADGARDTV